MVLILDEKCDLSFIIFYLITVIFQRKSQSLWAKNFRLLRFYIWQKNILYIPNMNTFLSKKKVLANYRNPVEKLSDRICVRAIWAFYPQLGDTCRNNYRAR